MRVVALISGGKDSNYNLMQCVAAGHEIVALANLQPRSKDELDSFMYQTVGHQGISFYAEAMGLPLFREETNGVAHHHHKWYTPTEGDEVEDLYRLLARVKNEMDIDGVSTGAVLSDYQRLRVENVCSRLGLISIAYLWRRDQSELLQEMIDGGLEAVVIKVAALGLDPSKHLGMRLQEIQPHLLKMNQKYGLNVCGEGGEYETFTLDCPLFSKRIVVDDYETVIHADDAFAPVGYLNFKKLSLVDKSDLSPYQGLSNLISNVKGPLEYVSDLELPDEQLANLASEGETMRNDESDSSSCNSIVSSNICSRCDTSVFKNSSPKICINNSGWLWIGSLIGNNPDPALALFEALTKMRDLLTLKQYSVEDLVSITMFVRDMSQYSKLNSIYTSIVDKNNAPVRICLETNLPDESTVLMEALAHKSVNSSPSNNERRAMHVQSISHWAPANIGPYSQAIKVGEIVYVAGQIALVPGTMQMVDGGICQECRLALRHVGRVISGIDQNSLLRDVVQAICYVTSQEFIRPARREWEKRSNNAIVDYVVVPALPRNAKIEWQVWAHRGNSRFQYEETGCRIDKRHKAFSRKRFNYENSVSAVVCYLILDNGASIEGDIALEMEEMENLQQEHIENFINYTLSKLNGGEPPPEDSACSFKIFYPVSQQLVSQYVHNVLSKSSATLPIAYSLVPVIHLHNVSTVLSICAVRHN